MTYGIEIKNSESIIRIIITDGKNQLSSESRILSIGNTAGTGYKCKQTQVCISQIQGFKAMEMFY